MKKYINANSKYVGSVLVYKGYDEDGKDWDGFYYKDEECTEKITTDEAVEAFLNNNLVVVEAGKEGAVDYLKALTIATWLEDEDDETTRMFEIIINEGCESAYVPVPEDEDVGKVLKVKEKDGLYQAAWMTLE